MEVVREVDDGSDEENFRKMVKNQKNMAAERAERADDRFKRLMDKNLKAEDEKTKAVFSEIEKQDLATGNDKSGVLSINDTSDLVNDI
jgi:hypothetical protein